MKISIERAVLLGALAHANSIVERRNTIPILSNVMLKAENGTLTIVATDLDIQITEIVEAVVDQPGATTVMVSTLLDIVRKLSGGAPVQIATDGAQLTVTSGRSRFKLNSLPTDDFPMIGAGELPHALEVTAAQISEMIADTRFAMSTEETRYYLNGIFLETRNGMLKAVATDGHRLALSAIAYEGPDIPDIIVPRKAVAEVHKLLGEVKGDIRIGLSGSKIRFDLGNVVLVSKLIDGTFPDYNRVIPTGNDKVMSTEVTTITTAADRVSIMSAEKTRALTMNLKRDLVELVVTSPENGTANEEIVADCAHDMRIGFNSRYLQDILAQIDTDEVEFHFGDPASPVLIKQKEEPSAAREKTWILMPMRT